MNLQLKQYISLKPTWKQQVIFAGNKCIHVVAYDWLKKTDATKPKAELGAANHISQKLASWRTKAEEMLPLKIRFK